MRALGAWRRVSGMESPDGWTYRVAINVVRRRARRAALERRLLARSDRPPASVPAPAGEAWAAVADLPTRQRTAVVLRFVADLTEAQIAQAMGITRSTVSSTLADAARALGHALADPPDGPPGPTPAGLAGPLPRPPETTMDDDPIRSNDVGGLARLAQPLVADPPVATAPLGEIRRRAARRARQRTAALAVVAVAVLALGGTALARAGREGPARAGRHQPRHRWRSRTSASTWIHERRQPRSGRWRCPAGGPGGGEPGLRRTRTGLPAVPLLLRRPARPAAAAPAGRLPSVFSADIVGGQAEARTLYARLLTSRVCVADGLPYPSLEAPALGSIPTGARSARAAAGTR